MSVRAKGRDDVAVVGGGPAGLLAALLTARAGVGVTLVAPPPPSDTRTTALLEGSVAILRAAGLWDRLRDGAAPLRKLRIADGGRRLFRAPEVTFDATEIGAEAFGWNVANSELSAALTDALAALPNVRTIAEQAQTSTRREDGVSLVTASGIAIDVALAIAADGKNSMLREAAGIGFRSHKPAQTALAFSTTHEASHDDVSTEIQSEEGPFTLVPLPGRRSSVVWVARPEEAERLLALSPEALGAAVTAKSGRLLGAMTVEGRVGAFPITVGVAARFAANRTLLVGEAGHALPPIGAQGLNLGVRDAARAAKVVAEALAQGRDLGDDGVMRAYGRARAADVLSRTAATDLFNRSLLTGFVPAHIARGLGLGVLARVGPLRRLVMREGLAGAPSF